MAQAYSNDLRMRIVKAVESGMQQIEAAAVFSVHENTVYNICKKYRQTGSVAAKEHARRGPIPKISIDKLKEIYTEYPDTYQWEAAKMLGVAQSTVCNNLKKLDFTQKKEFNLRGRRF